MSDNSSSRLEKVLAALVGRAKYDHSKRPPTRRSDGFGLPFFSPTELKPEPVELTRVEHPDGRVSQYPPPDRWNDWVEWDGKAWPNRVARRYTLVPTICFNCESACGLLAYVDRETLEI